MQQEGNGNQKKRRVRWGCLGVILALAVMVAAAAGLVVAGFAALGKGVDIRVGRASKGVDEAPDFNEVWSCGKGDTKVVGVWLTGLIDLGPEESVFGSASRPAELALKAIRRATHDADVRALIVVIDSGGGGITASDVLYRALVQFREAQPGRKVLALLGDVAASGGYYVAAAADYIMAHPTTITGSIGVLMQTLNVRGLSEKIGVHDVTIKSGKDKDMLNPFRDLTEEQRSVLQGIVDELHQRFVSIVATARHLPEEQVRAVSDSQVFTAQTALSMGLIDELGYWEDAVKKAAELLGSGDVKVYRYEREFSFTDFLRSSARWRPLSEWLGRPPQSRLMYLWRF